MRKWYLAIGAAMSLALIQAGEAQAWIGFGINVGVPVGPCYYPYYRPYPIYVGGPYYYGPAPVYVSPPPPAYVQQPTYAPPPPPQLPQPTPVGVAPGTTAQNAGYLEASSAPGSADLPQANVGQYIQQLSNPNDQVRADAAVQLGRMKAYQALDPLISVLHGDRSPLARESAARALGLIAHPRSLSALQTAAQADNDRDVRHSAQFAAEVIRGNMKRN
jgi:hypothetical protein